MQSRALQPRRLARRAENQIAVIEALKLKNVGIVYNLHHGHDHLDRFPELLERDETPPSRSQPEWHGERTARSSRRRSFHCCAGERPELLKIIRESGYSGPIGILGHTQDDAAERLADNLDGLAWLKAKLVGKETPGMPKYRTYKP